MILAIDGASTDLSVAIADAPGAILAEDAWSSAQRQSAELLPRILLVLERAGVPIDGVSAVAVGSGPGSFTGLRVAMALAKGLAIGLSIPIVGIPSLEAWLDAEPDASAALARAGAREAYVVARGAGEPAVVDRGDLGGLRGPFVVPTELAGAFELTDTRPPRAAGAIARRAAERLADATEGDDLSTLEPIYVRAPRGLRAVNGERVKWL